MSVRRRRQSPTSVGVASITKFGGLEWSERVHTVVEVPERFEQALVEEALRPEEWGFRPRRASPTLIPVRWDVGDDAGQGLRQQRLKRAALLRAVRVGVEH